MKFSSSVDALSKENHFLRLVVKVSLGVICALVVQAYFLYNKEPILVEKSTRGFQIVEPVKFSLNEGDLKNAIKILLKARFESDAISPELFLSSRQLELRDAEQRELKNRSMEQSIVVRNVKVSKSEGWAEFDRVLALGEIRSALRTKVRLGFEEETPNELNPYGLVLSVAEPEKAEEKK